MTMKSVPVLISFAAITASQFVLGVWVIVLSARKKGVVLLLDQRDYSYSEHLRAQANRFHRYPSMHITCAYSTGIGLWRSLLRASLSSTVRARRLST
jgi:hypothetical protein